MTEGRWRPIAARVIRQVIADNPSAKGKELRRLVSKAYPFGERNYHPYKIWLSEVKAQLDPPPALEYVPDPNQPDLF